MFGASCRDSPPPPSPGPLATPHLVLSGSSLGACGPCAPPHQGVLRARCKGSWRKCSRGSRGLQGSRWTHWLAPLCPHLRFQELLTDVRGAADADEFVCQTPDRPQHPADHQQGRWAAPRPAPARPPFLTAVGAVLGLGTSVPGVVCAPVGFSLEWTGQVGVTQETGVPSRALDPLCSGSGPAPRPLTSPPMRSCCTCIHCYTRAVLHALTHKSVLPCDVLPGPSPVLRAHHVSSPSLVCPRCELRTRSQGPREQRLQRMCFCSRCRLVPS